jgi:carbamoyl-phosphate synthase large subunit
MALKNGFSVDKIHEITKIDHWFLYKLKNIFDLSAHLGEYPDIEGIPAPLLLKAKQSGFSDFQIARILYNSEPGDIASDSMMVRSFRKNLGIIPFVRQIDTLAAEYPAVTNYLYLTYHGSEHDLPYENDQKSVIVLGSGAYRIGSSVEFDWCSVNALKTVNNEGYRSVMINYNPETVSTDYDSCDRLYFDELTFERVMDIIELEHPKGVILSMGGQIPNNLATRLHASGVTVLGTSSDSIDAAENRHKFSMLCDRIEVDQPRWQELTDLDDIFQFVDDIGFPVLVRPSYVLSGAAMNVVSNPNELDHFLRLAAKVSKQYPVVVSEFIESAKEIEIDAVANKGEVIAYAISEHIEFAGVHSGDATIVFPAQKIYVETIRRIKRISRQIAKELNISGPFNIQFLAKDNDIKVIECNLRASRSFPFVSKVLKTNLIELATKIILGIPVQTPDKSSFDLDYVGIKASQFSFSRLQMADPVLGVDMVSTGEVGCIGDDYYEAILKAMLSVGYLIPKKSILLSTGPSRSKSEMVESARMLINLGFELYATRGTHTFFAQNDIPTTMVYWPDESESPNVLDLFKERKVELVINIPKNLSKTELDNDYSIRRSAIDYNIPLITNARLASAFITAFCRIPLEELSIKSWGEY